MSKKNESIERKISIILAMPEPNKKPTQKQIIANNAIIILGRLDSKIDAFLNFNKN